MTNATPSGGTDTTTRRLPVVPASVPRAREALDAFADRVDAERLDAARLLTSELVTNAVRHGPSDDRGVVDLLLAHDGARLRVEVRDGGTGFVRRDEQRAIGGWGLLLVERLSNRWGIEEGAPTRVWFEIDTPERVTG
jgi:anti-sigma regulatory factor (Ser/Thr protein kinase)